MADPYKVFYEPIPPSVSGIRFSESGTKADPSNELKTFVESHLAVTERKEIDSEFKKTFPLHKLNVNKIKKPQPR